MKTTDSHPLQISYVQARPDSGRVGLSLCPGKQQPGSMTGDWARDLDPDLDDVMRWGARHVVTLLTEGEMADLGVAGLDDGVTRRGMQWHHFPIEDAGVPHDAARDSLRALLDTLVLELASGFNVFVHCKGGLGRTGLMAGLLLRALGLPAERIVTDLRAVRPNALETGEQERFVAEFVLPETLSMVPQPVAQGCWRRGDAPDRRERFRGCLLAGAAGDALGAPLEFIKSADEIRRRFGPGGLTEYVRTYGKLGAITDDTQMTLFVAEGCIRAQKRYEGKGVCDPLTILELAHGRWLMTQGLPCPPMRRSHLDEKSIRRSWLLELSALNSQRAPGATCLEALERATAVDWSKGCGGVMRVAPIGLFFRSDQVFEMACEVAGLTHGHPTGKIAAGAFALMVHELLHGATIEQATQDVLQELATVDTNGETRDALREAIELARSDVAPDAAIARLGEGWIAEEALAIAVYCALSGATMADALIRAANHAGDSDSTASICGQLLGVAQGVGPLPASWLAPLELRCEIDVIACHLHDIAAHGSGTTFGEPGPHFRHYPPY